MRLENLISDHRMYTVRANQNVTTHDLSISTAHPGTIFVLANGFYLKAKADMVSIQTRR